MKKKKEGGGWLGFLMQQTSGKSEKGGLEFSLANLFKCMCFTHEDADDPQKQLVKIAVSLEDVADRLKKIEASAKGQNTVSFSSFRRHNSLKRASRVQSTAGMNRLVVVAHVQLT